MSIWANSWCDDFGLGKRGWFGVEFKYFTTLTDSYRWLKDGFFTCLATLLVMTAISPRACIALYSRTSTIPQLRNLDSALLPSVVLQLIEPSQETSTWRLSSWPCSSTSVWICFLLLRAISSFAWKVLILRNSVAFRRSLGANSVSAGASTSEALSPHSYDYEIVELADFSTVLLFLDQQIHKGLFATASAQRP